MQTLTRTAHEPMTPFMASLSPADRADAYRAADAFQKLMDEYHAKQEADRLTAEATGDPFEPNPATYAIPAAEAEAANRRVRHARNTAAVAARGKQIEAADAARAGKGGEK